MTWRNQRRDSKGRWTKGGPVFAVVALGSATVIGTSGVTAIGPGGALNSALSPAVRAKLVKGSKSARKGNREATWKDLGLKRRRQQLERYASCVVNSYGDVNRFFVRTPCRSVRRMLFTFDAGQGDSIIVSVSWVQMYNAGAARRLKKLADRDGTGNVSPLPEQLVGVDHVRWSGDYYDSRRSGRMTVIAEAEAVDGAPDPKFVDGVAFVAKFLPRP